MEHSFELSDPMDWSIPRIFKVRQMTQVEPCLQVFLIPPWLPVKGDQSSTLTHCRGCLDPCRSSYVFIWWRHDFNRDHVAVPVNPMVGSSGTSHCKRFCIAVPPQLGPYPVILISLSAFPLFRHLRCAIKYPGIKRSSMPGPSTRN